MSAPWWNDGYWGGIPVSELRSVVQDIASKASTRNPGGPVGWASPPDGAEIDYGIPASVEAFRTFYADMLTWLESVCDRTLTPSGKYTMTFHQCYVQGANSTIPITPTYLYIDGVDPAEYTRLSDVRPWIVLRTALDRMQYKAMVAVDTAARESIVTSNQNGFDNLGYDGSMEPVKTGLGRISWSTYDPDTAAYIAAINAYKAALDAAHTGMVGLYNGEPDTAFDEGIEVYKVTALAERRHGTYLSIQYEGLDYWDLWSENFGIVEKTDGIRIEIPELDRIDGDTITRMRVEWAALTGATWAGTPVETVETNYGLLEDGALNTVDGVEVMEITTDAVLCLVVGEGEISGGAPGTWTIEKRGGFEIAEFWAWVDLGSLYP